MSDLHGQELADEVKRTFLELPPDKQAAALIEIWAVIGWLEAPTAPGVPPAIADAPELRRAYIRGRTAALVARGVCQGAGGDE